jgi:hypothetical protein
MKIVGYPVCISDDKYHRNALLFNIGFVFDEHVETTPYRPILRKLGGLVESMERESGFLYNADKKALLAHVLPQILRDLTLHGECTIPVDTANIINLKLFPKLSEPAPVFDFQVPVAVRDLRALLENSGAATIDREWTFIMGLTCLLCMLLSRVGPGAAANRAIHRRRTLRAAHQPGGGR